MLVGSISLEGQFYRASSYDQQDGLSSQFVWDINQDQKGQMWFLTQAGVDIFDGFTWQNIKQTPEGLLLPSRRMARIYKDGANGFWIIGINNDDKYVIVNYNFATEMWQEYPNPAIIPHKLNYSAVQETDKGTQFLISTSNKVFYKNLGKAEAWVTVALEGRIGRILNVGFVDNYPHVFTKSGVYRLVEERLIKQSYAFEQLDGFDKLGPLVAIKKELSGELALLGQKSIASTVGDKLDVHFTLNDADLFAYAYRNNQFETHPSYNALTLFNSRLYGRFYDQSYRPIYSKSHGEFTWANRFFVDRQQVVWIATDRGVKKFNNFSFESYNRETGLTDFEITSIKAFHDGQVFLGTNNGWQLFNNDKVLTNTIINKSSRHEINHRVQSSVFFKGKIYAAATKSGLIEIDTDKKTSVKYPESVHAVTVFQDSLYIIDSDNKVLCFDERFKPTLVSDLVKRFNNYYRMLYATDDGRLLAYGEYGVIDVRTNEHIFGFQEGESTQFYNTYSFTDYNEQYYAVGTLEGVHLLDKKSLTITKNWQGISHPVYALLKTKHHNNFFVGTDRGLYLIKENGQKYLYAEIDGLVGNELNRDALYEAEDGKIWIGTNKGLTILSTEMLINEVEPPLVGVNELFNLTKQQQITAKANVKIDPENSLAVRFYVSGFYNEDKLTIRYRLNENDDWIYETGTLTGEKLFYSLANGTYQFQIQAKEEKSDWSEIAYSQPFKVMPPIYQRVWFYALMSVLLFILAMVAFRLIYYKHQETRLNEELALRTKKLRDQQFKLEMQNRELLESNKSLDQFTSAVSHDLKSPLNSSIGLLELLDSSYSQEELLHFTGMVTNNLKKMKNFIIELIELSRNANQGVKFEALDLKEMILDVYALFDQTPVQKSIDKRLLINGDAPFHGDKSRLNVVFSNLISNAINYHNPSTNNPYCDIRVDVLAEEVFITVRDNGKGIPKRYQDQIFDMFFRAETTVSGTGLGLFLVKEVIDKMGGSIKVNSEEGMGTTFYIILPNGSSLSKRSKEASSGLPSKSDKPISIDFNDEKFSSKA